MENPNVNNTTTNNVNDTEMSESPSQAIKKHSPIFVHGIGNISRFTKKADHTYRF